eukprot:5415190-Prymnesium_polylepis.1
MRTVQGRTRSTASASAPPSHVAVARALAPVSRGVAGGAPSQWRCSVGSCAVFCASRLRMRGSSRRERPPPEASRTSFATACAQRDETGPLGGPPACCAIIDAKSACAAHGSSGCGYGG